MLLGRYFSYLPPLACICQVVQASRCRRVPSPEGPAATGRREAAGKSGAG